MDVINGQCGKAGCEDGHGSSASTSSCQLPGGFHFGGGWAPLELIAGKPGAQAARRYPDTGDWAVAHSTKVDGCAFQDRDGGSKWGQRLRGWMVLVVVRPFRAILQRWDG